MRRSRKMLYILPNLFTFSSVFCALLSIHWSTAGGSTAGGNAVHFYQAALAILFAAVFDLVDGRVARLTHTESEIGVQLDSLADVLSFGVAPAVLIYRWGLQDIWLGGIDVGFTVCFLYTSCGAFRLARFNVLTARRDREVAAAAATGDALEVVPPSAHFIGLPIPAAACALAALVFAHHQTDVAVLQKQVTLLVLMPVLSWLMISPVRYQTFKHLHFSKRSFLALLAVLGLGALVTVRTAPAMTLLFVLAGYISLGLVRYAVSGPVWLARRLHARRRARHALEDELAEDVDAIDAIDDSEPDPMGEPE